MNWNIFWGLWCLAFAIGCWIIANATGFRKYRRNERCSSHILGKIIRYSAINYGDIHIPLVEYAVSSKVYKVAGPKFLSATVITVNTPFSNPEAKIETNLTTRDNLPKKLKVKMYKNSLTSVCKSSPLEELYPIGEIVDVYYNPRKPKEAFVQRFEGVCTWIVILLVSIAVMLTVGSLIFMMGPKIVM